MKRLLKYLLIFLVACAPGTGLRDFAPGIKYKLAEIGESDESLSNGDFLMIEVSFCSDANCSETSESFVTFTEIDSSGPGKFWTGRFVGDKLVVIVDSIADMYWRDLLLLNQKKYTWPLIYKANLVAGLKNRKPMNGSVKTDSLLHFREDRLISKFLAESGNWEEKSGCHLKVEKWGTGDTIKEGREVVLEYEAFFLDGEKFDDTNQWKDSLKFNFGTPFQIILGLEFGLAGLTEGTEAKLIIPSQLAFGREGSATGIVPPFEPLIYKLKITSVKESEL